jgi:hypothetical protein
MGRGERQELEKVYDQRCGEALLLSGSRARVGILVAGAAPRAFTAGTETD